MKYKAEKCEHCLQTKTYALPLDRGTAMIVLAIYNAVRRLDRNRVHLNDDMELSRKDIDDGFGGLQGAVAAGYMSSWMKGNVLRAKYHGLVAQVDGGGQGEYLITPKGAQFLRGMRIPRVAVVEKRTHTKLAYHEPDVETCTFGQLMAKETPFWDLSDVQRYIPEGPADQMPLIPISTGLPTETESGRAGDGSTLSV